MDRRFSSLACYRCELNHVGKQKAPGSIANHLRLVSLLTGVAVAGLNTESIQAEFNILCH